MSNNSITAYLASGTSAARPSAPPGSISTGSESFYYATDTKVLYRWNAATPGWDADVLVDVTDGTNSVAATSTLTLDGALVSGSAGSATVKIGSLGVNAVSASTSTTTLTMAIQHGTQKITLSSNTTFTLDAGIDGQVCLLELIQDATGSRTVAFDSSVEFGTDITSFTATTTASAIDEVLVKYSSTKSKWLFLAYTRGF